MENDDQQPRGRYEGVKPDNQQGNDKTREQVEEARKAYEEALKKGSKNG